MMLTGGEKYNTKKIIVKISEIYPKIKEITDDGSYVNNNNSLSSLYDYTLDIFNMLQEVHFYKKVNSTNKQVLIEVVNKIPDLQEELIKLVESDTTNRDAVLRQIMDELGIVDPNAKKKRSLW